MLTEKESNVIGAIRECSKGVDFAERSPGQWLSLIHDMSAPTYAPDNSEARKIVDIYQLLVVGTLMFEALSQHMGESEPVGLEEELKYREQAGEESVESMLAEPVEEMTVEATDEPLLDITIEFHASVPPELRQEVLEEIKEQTKHEYIDLAYLLWMLADLT